MSVRVNGDGEAVTEALEAFVQKDLHAHPAAPTPDDVADRVAWSARASGSEPDVPRLRNALKLMALPGDADEGWTALRKQTLREFLDGDDALILADDERKQLEELVARNPPDLGPTLAKFSPDSKIAVDNLRERLRDARRQLGVERALPLALEAANIKPAQSEAVKLTRQALDDLFPSGEAAGSAKLALSAQVAGEPVLNRGFSHSVGRNLDRSLLVSVVAVLLFLYLLFRSVRLAVVCMVPAMLYHRRHLRRRGRLGRAHRPRHVAGRRHRHRRRRRLRHALHVVLEAPERRRSVAHSGPGDGGLDRPRGARLHRAGARQVAGHAPVRHPGRPVDVALGASDLLARSRAPE